MDAEDDPVSTRRKKRKLAQDGIYVLRPMVEDIPLAPEESSSATRITCVELWGQ